MMPIVEILPGEKVACNKGYIVNDRYTSLKQERF
jgi:hypothetical protein